MLRGSRDGDGHAVHLFAALLHGEAVVTGQRQIPDKTGEIKAFGPLPGGLDIAGAVITADALHTVRDHANYLRKRRAFYVFTIKENAQAVRGPGPGNHQPPRRQGQPRNARGWPAGCCRVDRTRRS